MKEIQFREHNCAECKHIKRVGVLDSATLYCTAGKKARRLPKAGVKRKVADWCPKKISPPRCRIFGFKNEEEENLDFLINRNGDTNIIRDLAFPASHRYKVRCTYPLDMTAKQFWSALEEQSVFDIFSDAELTQGEVIEIDDGLRPYYFYFSYQCKIYPVQLFDLEKTEEGV